MATKHFFITLLIFLGMLVLGLAGTLLVSHFDGKEARNDLRTDIAPE
ncbi:MAG: hypothetical protein WD963_01685 [Candidatus Paceibacterota bacterium]